MAVHQGSQSLQPIARGAGRAMTAAAAYRAGVSITDERTGLVFDYTRKGGVEHAEVCLPPGAPEWAKDRSTLWNENEKAHKRGDAIVGREYRIDLPAELDLETRRSIVSEFAHEISERYGIAVDVALHRPDRHGDQRNFHAHVLMSTKTLGERGFGNKVIELDPIACKKAGRETMADWSRPRWAEICNRELERAGIDKKYEHRTLKAQRAEALEKDDVERAAELDRAPTKHEGPTVTTMRRRGEFTDLAEANDRIKAAAELGRFLREVAQTEQQIIDLETSLSAALAERSQESAKPGQSLRERLQSRLEEARLQPEVDPRSGTSNRPLDEPAVLSERKSDTTAQSLERLERLGRLKQAVEDRREREAQMTRDRGAENRDR